MSIMTATRSLLHSFVFGLTAATTIWVSAASSPAAASVVRGDASPIKHVFVIVLENEAYNTAFGPASKAPYLARTLTAQGVLLRQYFGTGHLSVDNYIAMISGQAATPQTSLDCQVYADFTVTGTTADGQAIGDGCVYPSSIRTLADQLTAKGKTWRGYMEDMGNDPTRESATCGHPALNSPDLTQSAEGPSAAVPSGDQYATRHNPFVYFHSIIDSPICTTGVVNLNQLPQDLQSERSTPNFVFITPNLCNDGHDAPCKNGQPGGLVAANAFLLKWVPLILTSPAYRRDGLLIVTFDETEESGVQVSPTGASTYSYTGQTCCSEQPGPNLAPFPQSVALGADTYSFQSFGGDRTGTVLLSPFLKPGTISNTPFNHYSLLKSLENIFDTHEYLGYAAQPGLVGFFDGAHSDISVKRVKRPVRSLPLVR
jgi:phosphatidylinositol-3-phosphatase